MFGSFKRKTDKPNSANHDIEANDEMILSILSVWTVSINILNRKGHTIHDASKILQNLWNFYGDVLDSESNERNNTDTLDIPGNSLLQEQQLDIENMPVVLAGDLSESDNETSVITVSHEVEVHSTYNKSSETYLPFTLEISPQMTVFSPHRHINDEGIAYDKHDTEEILVDHSPVVLSETSFNEKSKDNIAHPNSCPKTPCKLNLTPVKLNDILILPKTPKRKGTMNSERTSFVLTSEEWQRKETEKKKIKELKEEGIKRRKLEREQKKLLQKNKQTGKVKEIAKGSKGKKQIKNIKIDSVKKTLRKEFHLPAPINTKEIEKGDISENAPQEHIDDVPSTSRCATATSRVYVTSADSIYKMLAESDDEN